MLDTLEGAPTGTRVALDAVVDALRFDAEGLLPAIAQHADSGEILMFAWMNRAALRETLQSGRVCYFSRSRGSLWRKGEQSGNVQQLKELRFDCDGDVVLMKIDQTGPACHTGRASCFYLKVEGEQVIVDRDIDVDPKDANNPQNPVRAPARYAVAFGGRLNGLADWLEVGASCERVSACAYRTREPAVYRDSFLRRGPGATL